MVGFFDFGQPFFRCFFDDFFLVLISANCLQPNVPSIRHLRKKFDKHLNTMKKFLQTKFKIAEEKWKKQTVAIKKAHHECIESLQVKLNQNVYSFFSFTHTHTGAYVCVHSQTNLFSLLVSECVCIALTSTAFEYTYTTIYIHSLFTHMRINTIDET